MIWVTAEDVVAIHSRIIQVSGGIDGLRDRAGLEAAIAAPLQSFGGEDLFPTDIEKIARIGFGLASNHAFIDGNKRIGAMVSNRQTTLRMDRHETIVAERCETFRYYCIVGVLG